MSRKLPKSKLGGKSKSSSQQLPLRAKYLSGIDDEDDDDDLIILKSTKKRKAKKLVSITAEDEGMPRA
jgi:hypothetical protein